MTSNKEVVLLWGNFRCSTIISWSSRSCNIIVIICNVPLCIMYLHKYIIKQVSLVYKELIQLQWFWFFLSSCVLLFLIQSRLYLNNLKTMAFLVHSSKFQQSQFYPVAVLETLDWASWFNASRTWLLVKLVRSTEDSLPNATLKSIILKLYIY